MNKVPGKTIVIVDDTPENLHLLTEMLSEQGYRVRSAPNGERALATVRKERPDMILLDILMPDMDGYEVCRRLKADDRLSSIPVIFISALDQVFDKVAAFAVGGLDYITKPFQIEEVLARVQTHLSLDDLRAQLEAQNHQLQEQYAELDAFAHTVAHDLKNPLTVLQGTLELIQDASANFDPELQELIRMSVGGTHKLRSIIDELLLLSSIRKEGVSPRPINMGEVVRQALGRLSNLVHKYEAVISVPETWPKVLGYGPWIEEVWANYLSNGIKYGGQPPRLQLSSALQPDGKIRFAVRDNGQGIDSAAQSQLFTEFTRLDRINAEGHGLGLSIVRRIMDKLGGECGVESAPGQGSQFYFTLPAA